MGRIRTIKPEFWKHEALSGLPESTHMLAAQLLNYADDEGYFNANPHLIQAECSPLRAPSVSVPESLRKLSAVGYIRLGRGEDGKRYGHIVNFLSHQCISHPKASKIKVVGIVWDEVRNDPDFFQEQSTLNGTGNREQGREGKKTEEGKPSSGADAPQPDLGLADGKPDWWTKRDRYGRVLGEVTDKLMFDVGKAVLGKSAGGQITKMRKLYHGDMRAVTDLLLQADEKSDPAQWWAGVLRKAELDEPVPPKHEVFPEREYRA